MKGRLIRILALMACLAAAAVIGCAQGSDPATLTILHTNDTHSSLVPFGPEGRYGGVARMATLIKRLKGSDPNALVLNAGDVFVGSFEFNKYLGYPELKLMENFYDAMGLGNHEFDLGTEVLAGVLSGQLAGQAAVGLPVLCANVNLASDKALKAFVRPNLVKTVNGIKVGLTAVVNTDAQNYSPAVYALLKDPYKTAGMQAARLRAEGCQVVICVSHLGKLADLMGLSQVPGIDIIVGGHSHSFVKTPYVLNGKIIVQAGEMGKALGALKVKMSGGKVEVDSYKLYSVTSAIKADPVVQATVDALKAGIESDPRFGKVYTKVVATAAADLEETWKAGDPNRDTAVGNLVTDAIRAGVRKAGFRAEIALEALGYTAYRIYKGPVVGNDILRAIPYGYDPASGLGFKINSVLLRGDQLLAGLEYSVSLVEYTEDLSLQPAGLTYRYDSRKAASPRLGEINRLDVASVRINGQPINPYGMYWVAMSEQLTGFLLSLGMMPAKVVPTGLLEYNLVSDFMKALKTLDYQAEGRVIDVRYQH
jgi:2',3'-cyclic-nucleotide 2'-phosphodiesterase (5'-nucleotidase family)